MHQEQSSNELHYGPFIKIPKNSSFRISQTLKKKITKSSEWVLDMGQYKKEKCRQLFREASQILATKIWFGYNLAPSIMQDIRYSPFICLKELWISQNLIQSIEMIATMQMPNLEEIWLRQNKITTIKTLRKGHWPAIKVISFYGNYILNPEKLNQLLSPLIQSIWLEYQLQQRVQGHDMAWIAKLESPHLKQICAGSLHRLVQPAVNTAISKKPVQLGLKILNKND